MRGSCGINIIFKILMPNFQEIIFLNAEVYIQL